MSAHAHFLQLQGQDEQAVDEIGSGDPGAAELPERESALLEYVRILTLEPGALRDADTDRLRAAGWSDEQIFEASFITAIFAFFNRMADAYGLDYRPPTGEAGWLPPALRG